MNPIAILLIGTMLQSAAPQFEVASIKRHVDSGQIVGGLIDTPPSGRISIVNATFRTILMSAYRLPDYLVIGGPAWVNEDRFDIQARPPADFQAESTRPCVGPDCPITRAHLMMQRLLAERFQLKTHRETRELPAYELTIAKNGFKLKEVPPPPSLQAGVPPPPPPPPPPPGNGPPESASSLPTPPPGIMMGFGNGFAGSAILFSGLVSMLAQNLGRPVIDKTGIKGYYDFKIVFSRDGLPAIAGNGPRLPPPGLNGPGLTASDPRPSIFTALQEEFGLKLDSTRGPVQVLVIDSVQKPTEN